jgi:hypothetical protein
MRKLLLIPFTVLLVTGCGQSKTEEAPVTLPPCDPGRASSTLATEAELNNWQRVSGSWNYGAMDTCNLSSITVTREGEFTVDNCGAVANGTLTEGELSGLETRVSVMMNLMDKGIWCDRIPLNGTTWDDQITLGNGKTRRVYYSTPDMGTCAYGKSESGAGLDAYLDSLAEKYRIRPATTPANPADPTIPNTPPAPGSATPGSNNDESIIDRIREAF